MLIVLLLLMQRNNLPKKHLSQIYTLKHSIGNCFAILSDLAYSLQYIHFLFKRQLHEVQLLLES